MNLRIRDILKICILPYVIFVTADTLNKLYNQYDILWWPNALFHFLGGLSMAVSGFFILDLLKKAGWVQIKPVALEVVLIVFFVATAAVLWEFYEFLSDKYLHTFSQISVADTMKDQFMGFLGAIAFNLGWLVVMAIGKNKINAQPSN